MELLPRKEEKFPRLKKLAFEEGDEKLENIHSSQKKTSNSNTHTT